MNHQPVTVQLAAPIKAHGQEVTSLTLRPMTVKDLRASGDPRVYGTDGSMHFSVAATAGLIAQLASIPPSSVDQMTPGDYDLCQTAVMGFFVQPTAESS
jgi:hypothetical protein